MPDAATPDPALDIDHSVARADPDRWLASRFVDDREARADLVALYAFDHELARALAVASEPLMAEIRLTWWSEALDEAFAGAHVRAHPTVQALAQSVRRRGLARGPLDSLIDARLGVIAAETFADEGALFAYVDATAGALMQSATAVLGHDGGLPAIQSAARAWGLSRAPRELGPEFLPPSLTPDRITAMTRQAVDSARTALRDLPVRAFPAIAYVTLAPAYAAGRTPGLLEKQARLLWATMRGAI